MYTVEYTNQNERQAAIAEAEGNGFVMLHDDFTKTGGLLTFDEPAPLTPEQLAEEKERVAMLKADELIDNITNLAQAKLFLKRLCKRLIRNGSLP